MLGQLGHVEELFYFSPEIRSNLLMIYGASVECWPHIFFQIFFLNIREKYSGKIFITVIFYEIICIWNIIFLDINLFIAEMRNTPYISAWPALICAVVPASNHTEKKLLILQSCTHQHYRHYLPLCWPPFVPAMISLY